MKSLAFEKCSSPLQNFLHNKGLENKGKINLLYVNTEYKLSMISNTIL